MVMGICCRIKPLLGPPHLKFQDHAVLGHELKIAVNCTEPYTWQPFANHVIEFTGGRMGLDL